LRFYPLSEEVGKEGSRMHIAIRLTV